MIAAPARGLVIRQHEGVVRAVLSPKYRAIDDSLLFDVLEHQVENASLGERFFVMGVASGPRTLLSLSAPIGSTGLFARADISNSHDGSSSLCLRVRAFESTADGLIPEWRLDDRVVHSGDDVDGRTEMLVLRTIRALVGPCLRS